MPKVLFIVENNYFPRDTRVINEASAITKKKGYKCFVLAPKLRGERTIELINEKIKCFRYPNYDAKNLFQLVIEYINAIFWIEIFTVFIVIKYKINIIHVANPPDFIIPALFFLKFLDVKFVFDVHDLSCYIFEEKVNKNKSVFKNLLVIIKMFYKLSLILTDSVIVVNGSVKNHVKNYTSKKKIFIIRNSNNKYYEYLIKIDKEKEEILSLVYIGIINSDYSLGIDNLIKIADCLEKKRINYLINIIGYGNYIEQLRYKIKKNECANKFRFLGYMELNKAFDIIKDSDFGVITLNKTKRSDIASSMKTIDYMCCGVPVCSLRLKEQLYTTEGIGIHTDTFEEMVEEMIKLYNDKEKYEEMRRKTLERFNKYLCWEKQEKELYRAYKILNANWV